MTKYRFYKNEAEWYVDLPEYLENGGSIGNLEMVEGADTMLDLVADGKNEIFLHIGTDAFKDSDVLTLLEICDPLKDGGYYLMKEFEGKEVNIKMWLCGVVEFVFGDIPKEIFIRKG